MISNLYENSITAFPDGISGFGNLAGKKSRSRRHQVDARERWA
jgi:hypothetical protein